MSVALFLGILMMISGCISQPTSYNESSSHGNGIPTVTEEEIDPVISLEGVWRYEDPAAGIDRRIKFEVGNAYIYTDQSKVFTKMRITLGSWEHAGGGRYILTRGAEGWEGNMYGYLNASVPMDIVRYDPKRNGLYFTIRPEEVYTPYSGKVGYVRPGTYYF